LGTCNAHTLRLSRFPSLHAPGRRTDVWQHATRETERKARRQARRQSGSVSAPWRSCPADGRHHGPLEVSRRTSPPPLLLLRHTHCTPRSRRAAQMLDVSASRSLSFAEVSGRLATCDGSIVVCFGRIYFLVKASVIRFRLRVLNRNHSGRLALPPRLLFSSYHPPPPSPHCFARWYAGQSQAC
jgi:hypothetical protein